MRGSGFCGCSLILILIHHSHACKTVDKDLCIDETPKTWSEASESCNLVVSNTSLHVGDPITDIPVPHRSSAPTYTSKDIHWIGATGTFTPWFKFAGCNMYFYFPFNTQWMPSLKIGPVAQCHQLCEKWRNTYKEFGINKTHCFCDDGEKTGNLKMVNCKRQNIEKFKNDLIGTGDKQGHYAFTLYRRVSVSTELDDLLGECLLETNKGNKTYPCDAADITNLMWDERQQNKITNDSLPRWTPYVRRLIINWKTGSSAVQDASVCIGVRNQNGSYETLPLRCNETHTSICKKVDITTGTTISNFETERGQTTVVHHIEDTTTSHTTSSERRTSIGHTTFVHNITSTTLFNRHKDQDGTTTPRTTRSSYGTSRGQSTFGQQITDSSPGDRQIDNNDTPASTLPLIIGSAVGGLLCIVIVGIIIVIFIKRRRPNKKENSHPAPTENVYYSEMKEDEKSQLTMKKEEPSPTFDSTDYDTMMSVNKEKITDDSEEYGKLLPNGETDVYNHTWDKPITEQFTDHVYSSTISGNDVNVYDHTVTSNTELTKESEEKRSISNRKDGNLYDHTDTNNTELI